MREQEDSGLLSSLETKATLSKNWLVGLLLFQRYKVTEIVNKFLLEGNKCMSEMH